MENSINTYITLFIFFKKIFLLRIHSVKIKLQQNKSVTITAFKYNSNKKNQL